MLSIKDVANYCGVSYTTVSHVLNKTRYVSPKTVEKVEKAVKELGYKPNHAARSLRKGKSMTIGVIDGSLSDFFFMEVIRVSQQVLEKHGYNLYFSFSEASGNCGDTNLFEHFNSREQDYIMQMVARDVEAIIINAINPDERIRQIVRECNIPFILFQRDLGPDYGIPVLSDDFKGGYDAASHLISLGHTRLAVMYGFTYESHAAKLRKMGIGQAVKDAGLSLSQDLCFDCFYDLKLTYEKTQAAMQRPNPPTAILYYSDTMAFSGIRALADLGLSVPEDVSVIGYDDIVQAEYSVPRLTTMNQNKKALGQVIANQTIKSLTGSGDSDNPMLPVQLVIRESCAPPKK